jgi:hypothetical protein
MPLWSKDIASMYNKNKIIGRYLSPVFILSVQYLNEERKFLPLRYQAVGP